MISIIGDPIKDAFFNIPRVQGQPLIPTTISRTILANLSRVDQALEGARALPQRISTRQLHLRREAGWGTWEEPARRSDGTPIIRPNGTPIMVRLTMPYAEMTPEQLEASIRLKDESAQQDRASLAAHRAAHAKLVAAAAQGRAATLQDILGELTDEEREAVHLA